MRAPQLNCRAHIGNVNERQDCHRRDWVPVPAGGERFRSVEAVLDSRNAISSYQGSRFAELDAVLRVLEKSSLGPR